MVRSEAAMLQHHQPARAGGQGVMVASRSQTSTTVATGRWAALRGHTTKIDGRPQLALRRHPVSMPSIGAMGSSAGLRGCHARMVTVDSDRHQRRLTISHREG